MKKLLPAGFAIVLLALLPASVLADAPPALTANFYVLNDAKYLDKIVSLSVAKVAMSTLTENKDGTKSVQAFTVNNASDGGWIWLVAKPDILSRVIKLCGTDSYDYLDSYRPHIIQGTLIKDDSNLVVRIEK